MTKSLDDFFRDWEGEALGFGYGTGEPCTLKALKDFMSAIPKRSYDYHVLEVTLTPTVAWLMINILCKEHALNYGVSPRFGWLDPNGEELKRYVDARSVEELVTIVQDCDDTTNFCYKTHCNCDDTERCLNPFWPAPR